MGASLLALAKYIYYIDIVRRKPMLITLGDLSFHSPSAQVYHPCREFQEFPKRAKMVLHENDA